MDYQDVLLKALEVSRNELKKEVRCYNTAFGLNRKTEKFKVPSHSIKKFLNQRQQQNILKRDKTQQKMKVLLDLTSQDKKAQRRVQAMKTNKSARKSVMGNKIDHINTAGTLDAFKQCDEDDYGYVSQESTDCFYKYLNKYKDIESNSDPLKKNFSGPGSKMKPGVHETCQNTLKGYKFVQERLSEREGKFIVSKPQESKNKGKNCDDKGVPAVALKKESVTNKSRIINSVPMSYHDLLKLANEKQFQPVLVDARPIKHKQDRLMTEE